MANEVAIATAMAAFLVVIIGILFSFLLMGEINWPCS
jgi:hypothetical protein